MRTTFVHSVRLAIMALTLGLSTFSYAQKEPAKYIAKIAPGSSFLGILDEFTDKSEIKVNDIYHEGRLLGFSFDQELTNDKNTIAKRLTALMNRDDVEYVVENISMKTMSDPSDPKFSDQWALEKVNALKAWDVGTGSRDIVVAVIDTGIDVNHEDLQDNIWINNGEVAGNNVDDDGNGYVDDINGWDFHGKDNNPHDETSDKNPGHGTHCSGIIGAVTDNGKGIAGMAPFVSLMAIRFLGADGSGDLMAAAKAIDYATNNGAHIISASWGAKAGRAQVGPILEAMERAEQKGVIFIAAAANNGTNNDITEFYPANAALPNMITVAASDPNDGKPSWSNFGKSNVHIASPGLDILSTIPGNSYRNLSGTSMATPLVSGVVAMMKSKGLLLGNDLSGAHIRSMLQLTGAMVEIETACNCRIDAFEGLKGVADEMLTIVPAAATVEPGTNAKFNGFGGQEPYTFTSSNTSAATITPEGQLTAVAEGETTLSMTDNEGSTIQSKAIYIATKNTGSTCPLDDPLMCMLMCMLDPNLPWCKDLPAPPGK